jgi:hypothetical protein
MKVGGRCDVQEHEDPFHSATEDAASSYCTAAETVERCTEQVGAGLALALA